MSKQKNFIDRCVVIHNGCYDYSKVIYQKSNEKVVITCRDHGDFEQTPSNHLNGTGCPSCGAIRSTTPKLKDTTWFIEKASEKHGGLYDYSKTVYIKSTEKVIITCQEHGDFEQTPAAHIFGQKCPSCALIKRAKLRTKNTDWFVEQANVVHGERYNYSLTQYKHNKNYIDIVCKKHGIFQQAPTYHLYGQGCPSCAIEFCADQVRLSFEDFVVRARNIHGAKYQYTDYTRGDIPVKIICDTHGEFIQTPGSHLSGHGCQKCNPHDSKAERDIRDFIKSLGVGVEDKGNRTIIKPKELDIVIPDKKLAIEYNGLYWHGDCRSDDRDNRVKYEMTLAVNYKLITIFEDEWLEKPDIIKKVLIHRLGLSEKGNAARKLHIHQIDGKLAKDFLEKEHIQGAPRTTKVSLGAFDKETLVAVMTFGYPTRQNSAEWELSRFATDGKSHVGLANKLFKFFINNYDPREIVSFSDNRWFEGGVYEKLGFKFDKEIPIDYSYAKGQKRFHKSGFRKDAIEKKFNYAFRDGETEGDAMKCLGFFRIWDCGKKRWVWNVS